MMTKKTDGKRPTVPASQKPTKPWSSIDNDKSRNDKRHDGEKISVEPIKTTDKQGPDRPEPPPTD